MSTLVAYITTFLGAGIRAIAGGVPLSPLQILWLNMVVDIPIAVALGFDEPTGGLMRRTPRPVGAAVLSAGSWVRLCVQGLAMTVDALVAYQIGAAQGGPVAGATALLTALSLLHLVVGLLSRDQRDTVFRRTAIPGPAQLRRFGIALLAILAAATLQPLQRLLGTTDMGFGLWTVCAALALGLLLFDELIKVAIRRRHHTNEE